MDPSMTDMQNGGLVSSHAGRWAALDPKAAIAWAAAEKNEGRRATALEAIAAVLTRTSESWDEMTTALEIIPDAHVRHEAMLQGLSRLPPAEALNHLNETAGEAREALLSHIVSDEPHLSLDQTLALASEYARMEDPDLDAVSERVFTERGPDAAMQWAATLPESLREQTVTALFGKWTDRDPQAAAVAAAGLQYSDLRRAAVEKVMERWVYEEPSEASEWLGNLSPGTARDAGASSVVKGTVRTEPEAAFAWAAAISDPDIRESTLSWISSFRGRPASWAAAIEAAPFSTEEKSRLLAPR
jgi:hypothetical protein